MKPVSITVAKLAKLVGFDLPTLQYFILETGESNEFGANEPANFNGSEKVLDFYNQEEIASRPYQSQIQQWLREKHDMCIVPVRVRPGHTNQIIYLDGHEWWLEGASIVDSSYEAALERGLEQALRYIVDKEE